MQQHQCILMAVLNSSVSINNVLSCLTCFKQYHLLAMRLPSLLVTCWSDELILIDFAAIIDHSTAWTTGWKTYTVSVAGGNVGTPYCITSYTEVSHHYFCSHSVTYNRHELLIQCIHLMVLTLHICMSIL
jgi:hypothetical protein